MARPSSTQQIRLVLLDQYALIRGILRTLLALQPQFAVMGEAVPGPDAVALVVQHQPDIILLNLLLQADAVALIPTLLAAAHHARLLVVVEPQKQDLPEQAIRLGATGVVRIDAPPAVLVDAIMKVHAGEVWASRRLLMQVFTNLLQAAPSGEADPEIIKISRLTARERAVIPLVAAGLRTQEIAQQLSIADSTARHHLSAIYRKLAVRDRLGLIVYAYRHGLVAPPV